MSATDFRPAIRLETVIGDPDAPRKRLLMIVNPYASTVSDRLRNLVISALRGTYEVNAIDTERRDHATELAREAAQERYDAVVAFGGDGTVNEVANGLVGTATPLTCLPGGRANVYCRMLGIPADVIDATENLLALADRWGARAVDLGRVGQRHFLFSAGVGLDAEVVERADAHPRVKSKLGQYYYAWVAATIYGLHYLFRPLRLSASFGAADLSNDEPEAAASDVPGDDPVAGVTVVVQNGAKYTYFGDRGIEMAGGAELDSGDLAGLILRRTSPLDIPSIAWRALSAKAKVADHRQVQEFSGKQHVTVRSLDQRELPVQVDGDYIGTAAELEFSVVVGALRVLA